MTGQLKADDFMNMQLRIFRPFLYLAIVVLGVLAAVAGVCLVALIEPAGFLLLVPAGTMMSVGLCRLWEMGCDPRGLALPGFPRGLRRKLSPARTVRSGRKAIRDFLAIELTSKRKTDRRRKPAPVERAARPVVNPADRVQIQQAS